MLPLAKARSLSKRQRAATAREKKASGGRNNLLLIHQLQK